MHVLVKEILIFLLYRETMLKIKEKIANLNFASRLQTICKGKYEQRELINLNTSCYGKHAMLIECHL